MVPARTALPESRRSIPKLGKTLRLARERAGLSQEQLARRMDVGLGTVSNCERGLAPRASTLQKYLECLPHLHAHDVLLRSTSRAPRASHAAWSRIADAHGFRARAIRRIVHVHSPELRRTIVEILGMRCDSADPLDSTVRTALMRAACLGSNRLLRELSASPSDLDGNVERIQDGPVVHEFRFSKGRRGELTYRRTETEPRALGAAPSEGLESPLDGTSLVIDYPVERLELRVRFQDSRLRADARCHAWPAPLPPDPTDGDVARELHPDGVDLTIAPGRLALRIDRPLPGLRYGLGWPREPSGALPPGVCGAGPVRARTTGERLREVRESAGLSLRDAERVTRISHVTIRHAERGGDVQLRTLQRYLDAFPELSPQDLLRAEPPEGSLLPEEAWRYYRQLYGLVASDLSKTLWIDAAGTCRRVVETRRLRSLRGSPRDLRIRRGLQRAVLQGAAGVLRQIESRQAETMRTRVVYRSGDATEHEFTFPRDVARSGITYRQHFARKPLYLLTERRMRRRVGGDGPFAEGTSLPVPYPCRRLSLVVTFPRGYRPRELRSYAWPNVLVPDADLAELAGPEELPRGHLVHRGRVATLSVERPLVGFKYAIGWVLP